LLLHISQRNSLLDESGSGHSVYDDEEEEEEEYDEDEEEVEEADDQDSADWSSSGDPPPSPSPSIAATAGGGSQTEASASVAAPVPANAAPGSMHHLHRRVDDGTRPDARGVAWSQSIGSSSSSGGRKAGNRRGGAGTMQRSHLNGFDANARQTVRSYQGRDAFSTAQLIEKEDRGDAASDDNDSLDSHSVATSLVVEVISSTYNLRAVPA